MLFFLSLSIEGALAGALYALIALAFVVVYKASRVINFALGEWQMLATLLVATGLHVLGLDLAAAMAIACAGMFVCAFLFNSLVLRHLVGQPLISLLMVTLGVGALIRGVAQLFSGSVSGGISLPIRSEPLVVQSSAYSGRKAGRCAHCGIHDRARRLVSSTKPNRGGAARNSR